MVYETRISPPGGPYYLAGKKFTRHGHGPEVLKETTTLYTLLHEGGDESGPVIGAGMLTLGTGQLMSMVHSLRVSNAKSGFDTTRGLSKFLRFFLGELWETYLSPVTCVVRSRAAASGLRNPPSCLAGGAGKQSGRVRALSLGSDR